MNLKRGFGFEYFMYLPEIIKAYSSYGRIIDDV